MTFIQIINQAIRNVGNQGILAERLGIDESTLSRKKNDEICWKIKEIDMILSIAGVNEEYKRQVKTLKDACRIFLENGNT